MSFFQYCEYNKQNSIHLYCFAFLDITRGKWKNMFLEIWLQTCILRKQKLDNLTIADQSDSVLSSQYIITQSTVGVVITVLEPLQIWLNDTLKGSKWKYRILMWCYKFAQAYIAWHLVHPLTLLWLETRQCSHTFTRCSKQNKLVTFLFGHLQRPIATRAVLRTHRQMQVC